MGHKSKDSCMVTHTQQHRVKKNSSSWIHLEIRVLKQSYFSLGESVRIAQEVVQTSWEGLGDQALLW